MKNRHLASCKEALERVVQESQAVCAKYAARDPKLSEAVANFERIFKARINDLNPKIMIYGIYNAGKSTLLNALVGDMKAEMNDVPTTVKVTPYQWNEYTIYDTPGINAPKKDEEVSKAQLEKSDVIIFVMDTEGAFNLGKNYRELVDIVNDKKRLLIVLNNKSGFDLQEDVDQIEKIKTNIYRDFAELYGSKDPKWLAERFQMIVVNAQDALTARTNRELSEQDAADLLQASNIGALETAIVGEYAKASGFTVLAELAKQLGDEISSVKGWLKGLEGDALSQKGLDTFDEIQKQQEFLLNKVSDYARDEGEVLKDDVYRILTTSKDSDDAKKAIQKATEDLAIKINDYLAQEASKVAQRVDTQIGDFAKVVEAESFDVEVKCADTPEETSVVPTDVAHGETADSSAAGLTATMATAAIAQPIIKKGVVAALPLVSSIPVVGPIVAPILPVAVPVLLAVMAFRALFGGSSAEKREQEKMERARQVMETQIAQQQEIARRKQECVDESARIARKILSGLIGAFRKRIGELFEPALARVRDAISASRAESASIMEDMRTLTRLADELNQLTATF